MYKIKWIYRHPGIYNFLDTVVNLGLSDKARAYLLKSIKGRILEVGVGSGKSIPYFNGVEFYGVDLSLSMLKMAKRYAQNLCLASAYNLPFKSYSFDKVLFIYTLRVLNSQPKALEEAFRVGGDVIILEFKPSIQLLELLGRKVFGSYAINKNLLNDFSHRSYLSRIDIYESIYKSTQKIDKKGLPSIM